MNYICHSGGCPGSDLEWEKECKKYGIKTIAYSFPNHVQYGGNPRILTIEELNEGYEHVLKANETLKRNPQTQPTYIKNLLNRNWFQVKNSDAIYAIGNLLNEYTVDGGTGWAIQMGIDENKSIFVFDQKDNNWVYYNYKNNRFQFFGDNPILTNNFAGIGTRKINKFGINAIKKTLKYSIK